MSPEDIKVIFSNISELAVFSDTFCEQIEGALGSIIDGGQGDDRIGALFLEVVSKCVVIF
jgi:dynamin-binding protein